MVKNYDEVLFLTRFNDERIKKIVSEMEIVLGYTIVAIHDKFVVLDLGSYKESFTWFELYKLGVGATKEPSVP